MSGRTGVPQYVGGANRQFPGRHLGPRSTAFMAGCGITRTAPEKGLSVRQGQRVLWPTKLTAADRSTGTRCRPGTSGTPIENRPEVETEALLSCRWRPAAPGVADGVAG